jgi:hypothetical protein
MWNLLSLSFVWFIGTSYFMSLNMHIHSYVLEVCMLLHMYEWMNVCMSVCVYVHMQVCRYMCTYICKYACMFCVCTWVYFTKRNCKYWMMFLFLWSWTCYFLSVYLLAHIWCMCVTPVCAFMSWAVYVYLFKCKRQKEIVTDVSPTPAWCWQKIIRSGALFQVCRCRINLK